MFSNRIAAIALVVLTLAGVASLVGTDDNEGALTSATQALAEKAAASRQSPNRQSQLPPAEVPSAPAPEPAAPQPAAPQVATEFADDETLIDTAEGFDPSPFDIGPEEGEVAVVVEDPATEGEVVPDMIQ